MVGLLQLTTLVRGQLDEFDYCIRRTPSPGLLRCAGQQALSSLQFLEEANNFTLATGVLMIKDDSLPASRIIPNFIDRDPLDFRQVLRHAGQIKTMPFALSVRLGSGERNQPADFILRKPTNPNRGMRAKTRGRTLEFVSIDRIGNNRQTECVPYSRVFQGAARVPLPSLCFE